MYRSLVVHVTFRVAPAKPIGHGPAPPAGCGRSADSLRLRSQITRKHPSPSASSTMHRSTGLMRALPRAATKARRANNALIGASRTLLTSAKPAVAPLASRCAVPRFAQSSADQRECAASCLRLFCSTGSWCGGSPEAGRSRLLSRSDHPPTRSGLQPVVAH